MTCWAGESVDSKRKSVQVRVFFLYLSNYLGVPTNRAADDESIGSDLPADWLENTDPRVKAWPLKKGGQRNFCTTAGGRCVHRVSLYGFLSWLWASNLRDSKPHYNCT
jgi:hypothetical protein